MSRAAGGAGAAGAPDTQTMMDRLKSLYFDKIKPLEETYNFGEFYSPSWKPSDFEAKPMVLLLGQYSVGKTSFIKYLIGREFPGARIGPEPTTDRFNAVMYAPEDRVTPGNAAAVDQDMPFSSLTRFGTEFLNKFQVSLCKSPVLNKVTFVDTPGVLSGEKQKLGRAYDFVKVTEWFAQRADMILLLFDAHKLDISDEFQAAIKALKGQDDKIRVVLNKADRVNSQQLMRVYGAMMWSLGKVVNTPEVMRVYIGSFWDEACANPDLALMFKAEQSDLLRDLYELPRYAAVRKINELVKRARMAKVHALIIGHIKGNMPFFGQEKYQRKVLDELADEFFAVMKKHRLPQGDFPDLKRFKEVASTYDFGKFKKLDEKLLSSAEDALSAGIPTLLKVLGQEDDARAAIEKEIHTSFVASGLAVPTVLAKSDEASVRMGAGSISGSPSVRGGAAAGGAGAAAGGAASEDPVKASPEEMFWAALMNKSDTDAEFKLIKGSSEGLLTISEARSMLQDSGLPMSTLMSMWNLSDIDKDGCLDSTEFAVCCYLIQEAKSGKPVPGVLPPSVVPPSKKSFIK